MRQGKCCVWLPEGSRGGESREIFHWNPGLQHDQVDQVPQVPCTAFWRVHAGGGGGGTAGPGNPSTWCFSVSVTFTQELLSPSLGFTRPNAMVPNVGICRWRVTVFGQVKL